MPEELFNFDAERCITAARLSVAELLRHPRVGPLLRAEKRFGGYFCVADEHGNPLLLIPIGSIADGKAEKYRTFCLEKAKRLASYRSHDLSRESRNPDREQWGGAVKAWPYIFSFSGFPEELDELLMFMVAVKTKTMSKEVARDRMFYFPTKYAQGNDSDVWKMD